MSWLEDPNSDNETNLFGCDGSLQQPSCTLSASATAVWDAIAVLRMIMSCLSLLGASSIIGSAIRKREVGHPKVLPIFSLAVADLFLALLWITGGGLWLRGTQDREFCYVVSLLTVILVCVSVNLTVVYASVSYSVIKKTDLSGLLAYTDPGSTFGWSNLKTILAYSTAWCFPVVIVVGLFGVVAGSTNILQNTDMCSCWCAPVLSNVMPYATHTQEGTAEFVHNVRKLVVVYGVVISVHFLVGLVALVAIYHKCLKHIRQLKNNYDPNKVCCTYGSEGRGQRWALISKGETKAWKRVFYFLMAFIVSGIFNFIFTLGVMGHEIDKLRRKETLEEGEDLSFEAFYKVFATLQAVSITTQGFLNAIVYSWTREDFLHIMAISGGSSSFTNIQQLMFTHGVEDSGTASGELGETWPVLDKVEEEEEEKEESGKWTPTQTKSMTTVLSHKICVNSSSS